MALTADPTIPREQIERMTGYVLPCKQLEVLHQRGFVRAYRNRKGEVILEQSHFDAVTRGQFGTTAPEKPAVNVADAEDRRPVHWMRRPEHQERLKAERLARLADEQDAEFLRQQIEAEYQAQRPERRAALVRHHAAKRRAAKLQRTPAWADKAAILDVYQRARDLTVATGVMHHVDHRIPLQGRMVSGLHVAENLRVVTWIENIKKGNRTEETT